MREGGGRDAARSRHILTCDHNTNVECPLGLQRVPAPSSFPTRTVTAPAMAKGTLEWVDEGDLIFTPVTVRAW